MGKLHELLAVEGQLETQAEKCRIDLLATFANKRHLFEEKLSTFRPFTETPALRETTDAQCFLQTTVRRELGWLSGILAKSLDASAQVAFANTQAKADVVLEDGTLLLVAIPATALLELEKRIKSVQELIAATPTLDPAKGFEPDASRGSDVFKARDVVKLRTQKTTRPLVKYEATKEHPAQVDLVTEDVPVGNVQQQEWSGLITPAEKAELLNRCEMLVRAIRTARSRANEQEINSNNKVGAKLLDFVFNGEV